MVVFPNPSNGDIQINTKLDSYQIDLFNILGVNVFSKNKLAYHTNLDLSYLKSGVYIIKITSSNKDLVKRLIIN